MSRARSTKKFLKFALTPLVIFTVVLVVPFVNGFYYTFTDWDGFEITKLVGFNNYTNTNTLNAMDADDIQASRLYTIPKLKEILLRLKADPIEIDRIKKKPELIALYKAIRGTKKNTLESLMEKLTLGTLTPAEEIRLQQMM